LETHIELDFEFSPNFKLTYELSNDFRYYKGPFEMVKPIKTNTLDDRSLLVIKQINPYFQKRKELLNTFKADYSVLFETIGAQTFWNNLESVGDFPYIIQVKNPCFENVFETNLVRTYNSKRNILKPFFPMETQLTVKGFCLPFIFKSEKPFLQFPVINTNLALKKAGFNLNFNTNLQPASFTNRKKIWSKVRQINITFSYRGVQVKTRPFQKNNKYLGFSFDLDKFVTSFKNFSKTT
jgi:hypothetical protein